MSSTTVTGTRTIFTCGTKSMSLIRLNAAFGVPQFDIPRDDEFFDGGQWPGELLAHLLQRDRLGDNYYYSTKRLTTNGLRTRARVKPELRTRKTQANRSKLIFCITDELAEMRNREEATRLAAEFSVEIPQGWGGQPNHERLQV